MIAFLFFFFSSPSIPEREHADTSINHCLVVQCRWTFPCSSLARLDSSETPRLFRFNEFRVKKKSVETFHVLDTRVVLASRLFKSCQMFTLLSFYKRCHVLCLLISTKRFWQWHELLTHQDMSIPSAWLSSVEFNLNLVVALVFDTQLCCHLTS
jgi:hypothetical protein